jgi:hypothetical protein
MQSKDSDQRTTKPLCLRLEPGHDLWLAQTAVAMQATAGVSVTKSAIVRGILNAVLTTKVDLGGCDSEAAVQVAVERALLYRQGSQSSSAESPNSRRW